MSPVSAALGCYCRLNGDYTSWIGAKNANGLRDRWPLEKTHLRLERIKGTDYMARYRSNLPQLGGDVFLTDGGIITTLIFPKDSLYRSSLRFT